jgi:hypothetical protein
MRIILAAALVAAPSSAFAQSVAATEPAPVAAELPPAPPPPTTRQIVLPPNTEVVVTPNDTLTTKGKALKEGAKFRISTMFDVMHEGYVVIPKGSFGEGTITWMTNKGAFGKSGKMEVSFDWLDLGGRRIPLTGNHRQEGEGNTGATVATAVAAGVFSAFVTGRSATLVNGQQLRARTVEPLTFVVPDNAMRVATGTLVPSAVAAPVAPAPVATPAAAPAATPVTSVAN